MRGLPLLIFFHLVILSGCSLLFGNKEEETPVQSEETPQSSSTSETKSESESEPSSESNPAVAKPSATDIELKQAKMWARIDELENQLSEERQKVALLERGMKTGIIPNELKGKKGSEAAAKSKKENAPVKEEKPLAKDLKDIESEIATKHEMAKKKQEEERARKLTDEEFRLKVAKAQDLYRAASFGASLAELSVIYRDHGDSSDGIVAYWSARNWVALKEFQTGVTKLNEYIAKYPNSTFVGRAKLELARAQNQLGLRSRSLQTLQEIIKSHPTEESAEMAQMEIEKMKRSL